MKSLITGPSEIILIDDDADDHQIFSEALKEAQPEIKFCAIKNEQELFAFFDSNSTPSLFFLDWSVHCRFKKCLELIKEQEHLKKIPVIIYSGLSSEEEINSLYERGAILFIKKPSSFSELIEILKTLLIIKWDEFKLQEEKGVLSKFTAIKFPQ